MIIVSVNDAAVEVVSITSFEKVFWYSKSKFYKKVYSNMIIHFYIYSKVCLKFGKSHITLPSI